MNVKNKLTKLANCIFNDSKLKDKNYKKLVYIKDKNPNVYYVLADYIEHFKFGSEFLHNFCDRVKKKNEMDDNNFDNEINALLNGIVPDNSPNNLIANCRIFSNGGNGINNTGGRSANNTYISNDPFLYH